MMRWAEVGNCSIWLLLMVAAILLHQSGVVECCVEEERLALLDLKAYMNSYSNPNLDYYVTPWFDSEERNCCQWDEVRCDVSTGRITELDLRTKVERDDEDATKKPWLFNVTLFRPFSQLTSLDLSNNIINGLVEDDGSTNISTLKNLQVLILTNSDFENGYISVSALTSLRTLNLQGTGLNESRFPLSQGNCEMKNLLNLDLSYNHFSGGFPSCLLNMSSLQTLDLSNNYFSGTIPKKISGLKYLEYLDLSFNNFEGGVSLPSLANLSKLYFLRLSRNNLDVHLGDSWQPTFRLQTLGLQGCNLNKTFGTSHKFWSHQTNLSELDLSDNNLYGAFPSWLLNNSKLRTLSLANNFFDKKLPKNIGVVLFQLEYLNLSKNHFEGLVPTSIGHLWLLETLDLSNNKFSGKLPRRLLSDCTSLEILLLSNNKLEGHIIPDYMNLPFLEWLKLSNNLFGGTINEALQNSSSLHYLDISNNNVTGQLPWWIGNFYGLLTLSVSQNNLNGRIPKEICTVGYRYLDLSHNNFSGSIPSCSNSCGYTYMHFQGNSLAGQIPNMSNCSNLQMLDLRDNQLSGSIPLWIGKLSSLLVLLLAGNNLQGSLPQQLCELGNINILDLSHNDLYGGLPICFGNMSFGMKTILINIEPMWSAGLSDNSVFWTDMYNIPEEVEFLAKNQHLSYMGRNLFLMSGLDLSYNKLTGDIPPQLGYLKKIQSLNLSHNFLSGFIPNQFSNLQQVESLDLSFNNLSGMIPSQLVELTFLEIFNVSYNNLFGRVPETGQFANFDERNYFGNPGLYGYHVNGLPPPTNALPPANATEEEEDEAGFDIVDFLWSFSMSGVVMFLATLVILCINPQWRGKCFEFFYWHILW